MLAQLHADEGSGTPLLYVPGIDGTGELLLGTSERLAREFRLLRFRYTADAEDDSYEALAASIAQLTRDAGIDRCLVLAESFGVAVGLRLALDHPQLVRGIALVNGFAHFGRRVSLAWSRMSAPLVPAWAFRLGRRWFAARELFGKDIDDETLQRFCSLPMSNGFDRAYQRRMSMIASLDLRPELSRVLQPAQLYASTDDHIVASRTAAEVMAALLPNASLQILEDAGHVVLPLPDEPWPERIHELALRAFGDA